MCKLTVFLNTPGYITPMVMHTYTVPNASYIQPYKVERSDLGYSSINRVYSIDVKGNQGVKRLATYYPGTINSTIAFASNSCSQNLSKYDCLNGDCVEASTINGPGRYESKEACELACGSSSGCNGECVSGAQISQLKNLANRLKRKNCGH